MAFYVLTSPSAWPHRLQPRTANLANGETLFNIGGCASCHAMPKQDDKRRLGGGLALATPFGTFKVPNISSDARFGIGAWSEEAFVNAMLRGVGRNGEHLYPAFPYTSYQRMSLDDVRDLFAFLKTLPAEAVASEPHALAFPFNVRRGLGLWKLLYLDGKTFTPDPAKSAALNRGAYLVEGPGHCAECHSPRNVFGGIIADRRFAGGVDAEGKGWVPNITPHADGIADLVGEGHRLPARKRAHARRRLGGLDHGGRMLQYRQAVSRGSGSHGGLPQVAAAARRQGRHRKSERHTAAGGRGTCFSQP